MNSTFKCARLTPLPCEGRSRIPTLDTLERLLAANGQHLVSVPDPVFGGVNDRRGKPFFVPDQLPRLPVDAALATVVLPPRADWSPSGRPRNPADPSERLLAYQVVLADGMPSGILRSIDGTLLVDAWAELHLPASIRRAWQPLVDRALSAGSRWATARSPSQGLLARKEIRWPEGFLD